MRTERNRVVTEFERADEAMRRLFGRDTVMVLATYGEKGVTARSVNGYYKDGAIYIVSHALSQKAKDIAFSGDAALCSGLNGMKGRAKNLGHPLAGENAALREELKEVFCAFYGRHVDEGDPNTCMFAVYLTSALLFEGGMKYIADYEHKTAVALAFTPNITV